MGKPQLALSRPPRAGPPQGGPPTDAAGRLVYKHEQSFEYLVAETLREGRQLSRGMHHPPGTRTAQSARKLSFDFQPQQAATSPSTLSGHGGDGGRFSGRLNPHSVHSLGEELPELAVGGAADDDPDVSHAGLGNHVHLLHRGLPMQPAEDVSKGGIL